MIPSLQRSSLFDLCPLKICAEVASSSWWSYSVTFLLKGLVKLSEWSSRVKRSRSNSCFLISASIAASGAQIYKTKVFEVNLDMTSTTEALRRYC